MKKIFYSGFGLTLLFLSACVGERENPASMSDDPAATKIIGGQATEETNSLSKRVAFIQNKALQSNCTGTIIDRHLILTSAHCTSSKASDLFVSFGVQPTGDSETDRTQEAAEQIIHPEYNARLNPGKNDLAIIGLRDPIPEEYEPLNIPKGNISLGYGVNFTAVGYGKHFGDPQNREMSQDRLRHVELTMKAIESEDHMNQVFQADQKSGQGTCQGDSGGPAIKLHQGVAYVVGLTASTNRYIPSGISESERQLYEERIAFCEVDSTYMNIQSFRGWITKNSQSLLNKLKLSDKNIQTH